MTIENSETVDGIGISKLDGKVVLLISDHLDWADLQGHMRTLAKKLEGYVAFAAGGGIEGTLPGSAGRQRRIELVWEQEPSHAAFDYLKSIKSQMHLVGFEFTHGKLPSDY